MAKSALLDDSLSYRQCGWKDHVGMRCQEDGSMSLDTTGKGPWYCSVHFSSLMGWPSPGKQKPPETQADIDARVSKIVPRKPGESEHDWSMRCKAYVLDRLGKISKRQTGRRLDWAENIIAREKAGMDVPSIAFQAAREALNEKGTEQREPGED